MSLFIPQLSLLSFPLEKIIKHTCSLPSKRTRCKDFQEENDCLNAQCSWTTVVEQPTKGAHSTGKCTSGYMHHIPHILHVIGQKVEKGFCDKEVVCTAFRNRETCEQEPHCKWDKGGVSTSGVSKYIKSEHSMHVFMNNVLALLPGCYARMPGDRGEEDEQEEEQKAISKATDQMFGHHLPLGTEEA